MKQAFLLSSLLLACNPMPSAPIADDQSETNQVNDNNLLWGVIPDLRFSDDSWPSVDIKMGTLVGPGKNPGCAVAVAKQGEFVYAHGYGQASGTEAWGVNTMAPIGSVAKTVTAIALMRLKRDGLIDFENTVGDYLDTDNAALSALKLADLVSHQAGLPKQASIEGTVMAGCRDGLAWAAPFCPVLGWLMSQPAGAFAQYQQNGWVAAPLGTYSNFGFNILGAIIDRVSTDSAMVPAAEKGYEAYVWSNVARHKKNDMSGGQMFTAALGHTWRDGGDIAHVARSMPADVDAFASLGFEEGVEVPSGGWMMTIGDLGRLALALGKNEVVTADELAEMSAGGGTVNGQTYGYGMWKKGISGELVKWHGGNIGTFGTIWMLWPNNDVVAINCNNTTANPFTAFSALAGDIRAYAQTETPIVNDGPAPTAQSQQQVAPFSYTVNSQNARLLQPANTLLPVQGLNGVRLQTRISGAAIGFTLIDGSRAQDLGAAPFSQRVATPKRTIQITTALGDVPLYEASLSTAFARNALAKAELSGMLNVDQMKGAWGSRATACKNAPCVRCASGETACVKVTFTGIYATK